MALMTDRLDLPSPYRKVVEALLREHVPDAESGHTAAASTA